MWPGAQRAWCYWPKTCSWICNHGKHSQWGGEEWNRIDWLVDHWAKFSLRWKNDVTWVEGGCCNLSRQRAGGRLVVTMVENIPALSELHPRIRWTLNSLKPILLSKNLTLGRGHLRYAKFQLNSIQPGDLPLDWILQPQYHKSSLSEPKFVLKPKHTWYLLQEPQAIVEKNLPCGIFMCG